MNGLDVSPTTLLVEERLRPAGEPSSESIDCLRFPDSEGEQPRVTMPGRAQRPFAPDGALARTLVTRLAENGDRLLALPTRTGAFAE